MKVYVELDRGNGVVETRGIEGSDEEVWEMVNSLDRSYGVLGILDEQGNEMPLGPYES